MESQCVNCGREPQLERRESDGLPFPLNWKDQAVRTVFWENHKVDIARDRIFMDIGALCGKWRMSRKTWYNKRKEWGIL